MKKHYILSFLTPCILMILLYMTVGVIGGDKNILTVDLANQYVEFFSALKNILSGVISPYYSFSKTLGGNLYGLITYYLISPLNLLIVLFDKTDIPLFILIINILKVSLSGLTSYIYFDKLYKDGKLNLMFSIIYSLMAYNIVYSQNIMWLDGVVLLPLIFLGVHKLLDRKPVLFYLSLTLSIICNYYIGYMLCIASLIYYIYQSYLKNKKIDIKNIIFCIKYILICVLTSGIVLLPSVYSLLQGKANGLLGDFVPNQRFAILDLITRFYIGTFKNSDLLGTLPNVYISVMWVFLVIYYFYNKKVDKNDKKATLILLIIFLISFVFSPINTLWHTLKNPVGFPFRYSFIFDFILLIISYESILKIKDIDKNFIKKFLLYGLLTTLLIDKFLYNSNTYYKIIGTFVLITIYIYYFYKRKSNSISKLIILLVISEMFLNSYMIVYNIKYQNKDKYTKFVTETGSIIDDIKKDKEFYRIEKDYFYSSNDELLLNYSGISHFSSVYESKTNELLKNLGIFNRFYITNYNGSTPVTNSLFNIKYILSHNDIPYYEKINSKYGINTYLNKYNLPLGFMVSDKILDLKIKENDPFINQNNILKSMDPNIKDVFSKCDYEIELNNVKIDEDSKKLTYKKINENYKASIKIKVNNNKDILYGYIYSDKFKKIDILVDEKSIIDINDENNYRYNVIELGNSNELEIVLLENEFKPEIIEFYDLDLEKFEEATNILNKNELKIIDYNSNYIKGSIDVLENDKVLYTSIPFDKGFNIYVDGEKYNIEKSLDTLIALKLSKGNHIIEFTYVPSGLKSGVVMSFIGLGIFILVRKKDS